MFEPALKEYSPLGWMTSDIDGVSSIGLLKAIACLGNNVLCLQGARGVKGGPGTFGW